MDLIYVFDLCGTAVFAISGAIRATRKQMDLFGVFVIGFVTAVGGGSIRDVLIGHQPVFWLHDINYVLIVMVFAVLTFLFHIYFEKIHHVLSLFDAIGLAVFTVIGIQKALFLYISPFFAVMMGVTTAVAGGIIRDILCSEIPLILRKEIYATACILGGIFYFVLRYFNAKEPIMVISSMLLVISIRLVSIYFNLSLPKKD